MSAKIYIAICENYKLEAKAVKNLEPDNNFDFIVFPSRCGRPQLDQAELENIISTCDSASEIHFLGSCCLADLAGENLKQCTFHHQTQCFYSLINKSFIDGLEQKGAHLITPGWLLNWQHHIENWGFTKDTARDFFAQSAKNICLLDTGTVLDAKPMAQNFAAFIGLPLDIIPIGLDYFKIFIRNIIWQSKIKASQEECINFKNRASDCLMAMDILSELSNFKTENEVIDKVIELFNLLFAPKEVEFFHLAKKHLNRLPNRKSLGPDISVPFNELNQNGFACIDNDHKGFWLLIKTEDIIIGVFKISEIAFPEYSRFYLNIAISIASMCGIVLRKLIATKELHKAEKMEAIGTMAGGIAHNFNNLLGVIIGFADMAKEEVSGTSKAADYLTNVLTAGDRAKKLVSNIMTFSHQNSTSRDCFQPNYLLEEYFMNMGNDIPLDIQIIKEINPDTKCICMEPRYFKLIAANLCKNAMESMKENGGVLRIILTNVELTNEDLLGEVEVEPGQYIQLSIIDTGRGISADNLDIIFNPFYTTKNIGDGDGIGLSIVNGIVRKCGGMVKAESKAGEGSTFKVFIPVSADEANCPKGQNVSYK